eukprot:887281_1
MGNIACQSAKNKSQKHRRNNLEHKTNRPTTITDAESKQQSCFECKQHGVIDLNHKVVGPIYNQNGEETMFISCNNNKIQKKILKQPQKQNNHRQDKNENQTKLTQEKLTNQNRK